MKWLIRFFFRSLRQILGPIVLLVEWLTTPRGVARAPEAQARLDALTARLSLYEFPTCPFCVKVRHEIRRQSLNIARRNARPEGEHRQALLAGGGEVKVPCLRIDKADGSTTWLYESDAIVAWLRDLASATDPDGLLDAATQEA